MSTLTFALGLIAELVPLFFLISTIVYLAVEALTPARIQALLAGRSQWLGVPLAAALGAITPFCSCSTVPLVNGMRRAGIPLAIVVAFLLASPMVNPVAVGLLWTTIGASYALLYTGAAMFISMAGAVVIARWYREPPAVLLAAAARGAGLNVLSAQPAAQRTFAQRLKTAATKSLTDLRKLWLPLLIAIGIGAAIHDAVPDAVLAHFAGPRSVWAVPAAALLGLPIYASIVVLVPLGSTLLAKGVGVGVVTAFLMGASGFSVPEGVLLARVLPGKLLARVLVVFATSIVLIGYGFQWWVS